MDYTGSCVGFQLYPMSLGGFREVLGQEEHAVRSQIALSVLSMSGRSGPSTLQECRFCDIAERTHLCVGLFPWQQLTDTGNTARSSSTTPFASMFLSHHYTVRSVGFYPLQRNIIYYSLKLLANKARFERQSAIPGIAQFREHFIQRVDADRDVCVGLFIVCLQPCRRSGYGLSANTEDRAEPVLGELSDAGVSNRAQKGEDRQWTPHQLSSRRRCGCVQCRTSW